MATSPMDSSPDKDSESAASGFSTELALLKSNNRVQIKMLTMLADECRSHGPTAIVKVVRAIESQLLKAKPTEKLCCLYLVDSIIKTIRGEGPDAIAAMTRAGGEQVVDSTFTEAFSHNIVSLFTNTFEKVDLETRRRLFNLRTTWPTYFPVSKLQALDEAVRRLDEKWPDFFTPVAPPHPPEAIPQAQAQSQELSLPAAPAPARTPSPVSGATRSVSTAGKQTELSARTSYSRRESALAWEPASHAHTSDAVPSDAEQTSIHREQLWQQIAQPQARPPHVPYSDYPGARRAPGSCLESVPAPSAAPPHVSVTASVLLPLHEPRADASGAHVATPAAAPLQAARNVHVNPLFLVGQQSSLVQSASSESASAQRRDPRQAAAAAARHVPTSVVVPLALHSEADAQLPVPQPSPNSASIPETSQASHSSSSSRASPPKRPHTARSATASATAIASAHASAAHSAPRESSSAAATVAAASPATGASDEFLARIKQLEEELANLKKSVAQPPSAQPTPGPSTPLISIFKPSSALLSGAAQSGSRKRPSPKKELLPASAGNSASAASTSATKPASEAVASKQSSTSAASNASVPLAQTECAEPSEKSAVQTSVSSALVLTPQSSATERAAPVMTEMEIASATGTRSVNIKVLANPPPPPPAETFKGGKTRARGSVPRPVLHAPATAGGSAPKRPAAGNGAGAGANKSTAAAASMDAFSKALQAQTQPAEAAKQSKGASTTVKQLLGSAGLEAKPLGASAPSIQAGALKRRASSSSSTLSSLSNSSAGAAGMASASVITKKPVAPTPATASSTIKTRTQQLQVKAKKNTSAGEKGSLVTAKNDASTPSTKALSETAAPVFSMTNRRRLIPRRRPAEEASGTGAGESKEAPAKTGGDQKSPLDSNRDSDSQKTPPQAGEGEPLANRIQSTGAGIAAGADASASSAAADRRTGEETPAAAAAAAESESGSVSCSPKKEHTSSPREDRSDASMPEAAEHGDRSSERWPRARGQRGDNKSFGNRERNRSGNQTQSARSTIRSSYSNPHQHYGRGSSPVPPHGRFGRRNQSRFGRGARGFHSDHRPLPPPPQPPRIEGGHFGGPFSEPEYRALAHGSFSHDMPSLPQSYFEGGARQFEPPMRHPHPQHWPRPPMQPPFHHAGPPHFSSPEQQHWSYEGAEEYEYYGGGPSPHLSADGSPSMPHMAPLPPPPDPYAPQRRGYPPALPVAPVAPMVRQQPYPGPPMGPPAEYVPEYLGPPAALGGMPMQHYWPNPAIGPEAYVPQMPQPPPPEVSQQQQQQIPQPQPPPQQQQIPQPPQPLDSGTSQWRIQLDTESMQAALQALTSNFVPDFTAFDIKQLSQRCEGVFRRLYAGHQCYFCGVRFQVSDETASSGGSVGPVDGELAAELVRYRSHLDAHYLKRHQQQQSAPGAGGQQHRKWFLCASDWLAYRPEASQTPLPEADTDERERGFASSATATGTTGEAGALAGGGASVKTESGLAVDRRIDYQPASTDVAECCAVCGESLVSAWDADAEEWRLHGALAVLTPSDEAAGSGRVLYHVACFDPSSLPPIPPTQGAAVVQTQPMGSATALVTAGAPAAPSAASVFTSDPNALLMQILAGRHK